MKTQKIFRLVALGVMLIAILLLAACGSSKTTDDSLQQYLDQNGLTQEDLDALAAAKQSEAAATQAPAAVTPETVPAVVTPETVTPAPTAVPTATPTPTAAPTPTPWVCVIKNPTSEWVTTGGRATFIAYADNDTAITWYLISPDGNTTLLASDASNYFGSVSVAGLGTDTITFYNIPLSMNNWRVQCAFSGIGGPAYTEACYIYVSAPAPTPTPTPVPTPTPAPSYDYASEADSLAWDSVYEVGSRTQEYNWHIGTRTDYYYDDSVHRADYNVTATYFDMDITFYFRADANMETYWPTGFEVWRTIDGVYQPIERHTFSDTWNITQCWADFDRAVQYVTNQYCW